MDDSTSSVSLNLFWRTLGGVCAVFLTLLLSVLLAQREQTNRDIDTVNSEIRGLREDIRIIQRELIRAGVIKDQKLEERVGFIVETEEKKS